MTSPIVELICLIHEIYHMDSTGASIVNIVEGQSLCGCLESIMLLLAGDAGVRLGAGHPPLSGLMSSC